MMKEKSSEGSKGIRTVTFLGLGHLRLARGRFKVKAIQGRDGTGTHGPMAIDAGIDQGIETLLARRGLMGLEGNKRRRG